MATRPAFNVDLEAVEAALAPVTYKPGWEIRAYLHEFEGVWLAITYDDLNAYNSDEPWPVRVNTAVPPVRSREAFWEWLQHRLIRIETHEMPRMVLHRRQVVPHDPHADPTPTTATRKAANIPVKGLDIGSGSGLYVSTTLEG
jgi:hypothetical protein